MARVERQVHFRQGKQAEGNKETDWLRIPGKWLQKMRVDPEHPGVTLFFDGENFSGGPVGKNGDAAWERQHEDSTEYFSLLCAAIVCLTVASEGRAVENTLNPNVDEGSMCYSCLPVSSSFSISSTLVFHFELVDKHHCMALRQFCNNLLQNCRVGRATVVQGSGVDTCPELASHAAKEWRRPLSGSH